MKRKLLLIFALWLATVALMALQKPVFLAYYATEAAKASVTEWGLVLWHGLKLDMTVAGYITALPILLLLINVWIHIPKRVGQALLKGYLLIVSILCGVLFAVDLGLYEYWGFRLDSTLLIYLSDPKEAMASVDLWSGVRQTLFMVAYSALLYAVYRPIVRLFDGEALGWRRALPWSVVMLLVAGLDFLAIRGGVGTSVANVSKVCFSPTLFLNHAATNPIFSFLSTLGKQENYAEVYPFYEAEVLAANFDTVRGNRPTTLAPTPLLRTQRPDIVLVLLESFGRTIYDADEGGEPIMPCLRQLAGEGVWFEHFYANSFRTDRGQMSILSGFPAQTKISLMKLTPKCLELPSIARSLGREGYRTQFVYGGDLNFTNQASYMYATGWQELVWQKDMDFDAPTAKWGYDDAVVGEWFAEEVTRRITQQTEPQLIGWLTLSSHEPFEVGDFARFEDPRTNAFAFTDACVGRMVERLRQSEAWKDLLIILIADHGTPAFRRGSHTQTEVQQIPMLWTGGAVERPCVVESYGSQIDLAATLLGQLGIAHDDFEYSKDLLHPETPKFAYYTYNEGFCVVDETGESSWDAPSDRTNEGASERQLTIGRTLLQQTYEDIERR